MLDLSQFFIPHIVEELRSQVAELTGILFVICKNLKSDMEKKFFGQHIASKIVVSALAGNLHRSRNNKKPLVMCFQGSSGTGKNYLSDLIASHMFKSEKLKKSQYHVIQGQTEFLLQTKINDYKENLHSTVKSAIKSCDTNLFVFDEVHYMPMGILNILTPILENNDVSIDSRNSIFIFITNTGYTSIIEKYFDLWVNGFSRENMTVEDFDTILLKSAFNEDGGLQKSSIIDSHVIDFFVPFLPLEKVHVEQCIEAELKNLEKHLDSELKSEILRIVAFGPEPEKLFATSGCKRIKQWVAAKLYSD
ncbi:torsin-1A-like isoform X2 [Myzus persicae]|uniref:torsin-1A-like isoform X2 n=1 Tax=Myzus persicae TaxID=13164 RepID=UPI000B93101D|nr:torsin-1A-like isoform X2 [Myzus persicae]